MAQRYSDRLDRVKSRCFKADYSSAIVDISRFEIPEKSGLFIGGGVRNPDCSKYEENKSPIDRTVLGTVAVAGSKDISDAVKNSRDVYRKTWSLSSGFERSRFLFSLARLLHHYADEFAILECLDTGRPISQIKQFDLVSASKALTYYAGWADKIEYATGKRGFEPYGVCGLLLPWSSPLLHAVMVLAPALACGNTVILKPAFSSPLSVLRLGGLCKEAGIPDGVVNVVTGDDVTSSILVSNCDLNHLFFFAEGVGSKQVARLLADSHASFSLNLNIGGCHIVFGDAAIDQAVDGIASSIFLQQGRSCSRIQLLLEDSIVEIFLMKLKRRLSKLRIGNPLDLNTDIACLHSESLLLQANAAISSLKAQGFVCNDQPGLLSPDSGFHVLSDSQLGLESGEGSLFREGDAPFLSIRRFHSFDEAVLIANASPDAYTAGIFTENKAKYTKISECLRADTIWSYSFNSLESFGASVGRANLLSFLRVNP